MSGESFCSVCLHARIQDTGQRSCVGWIAFVCEFVGVRGMHLNSPQNMMRGCCMARSWRRWLEGHELARLNCTRRPAVSCSLKRSHPATHAAVDIIESRSKLTLLHVSIRCVLSNVRRCWALRTDSRRHVQCGRWGLISALFRFVHQPTTTHTHTSMHTQQLPKNYPQNASKNLF